MTRMAERLAPFNDPQDVVQDAIERAWRDRARYDAARGNPTAWLLTITAAVAADAHRRTARRQRLAVTCFYFLDLTVADTANVMNCSEGTVKSTLSDARRALRSALGAAE